MVEKLKIGTLIKRIRKSKSLTQEQVANAMMITRPYLAKIENNHHQISSEKLTYILDYCNVNYDEFLFMKNDFKVSEKTGTYSEIIDMYVKNDFESVNKLKEHSQYKFEETQDIYYRHLVILCECIAMKFDIEKIPEFYRQELTEYLMSVNEWTYYELVLFNNFLYLFPPNTTMLLADNLIDRALKYKELKSDYEIIGMLLFNLINISFKIKNYKKIDIFLNVAKKLYSEQNRFFEQTMIKYYTGLRMILDKKEEGIGLSRQALEVFKLLDHHDLYTFYEGRLHQLLKEME